MQDMKGKYQNKTRKLITLQNNGYILLFFTHNSRTIPREPHLIISGFRRMLCFEHKPRAQHFMYSCNTDFTPNDLWRTPFMSATQKPVRQAFPLDPFGLNVSYIILLRNHVTSILYIYVTVKARRLANPRFYR
jgi:hypothetical protein